MGNDFSDYNVLFVDDEVPVLNAIRRGIRLETYNKFFASSGYEALSIINKENISVIVTDMRMPEMDGLELLKRIYRKDKQMVKIILSGYTNSSQIITTINALDIYKFIMKPWDLESELKPLIRSGLEEFDRKVEDRLSLKSAKGKNDLFKKLVQENKQTFASVKDDFKNIVKLNKMALNYSYFLGLLLDRGNIDYVQFKQEMTYLEGIIGRYIQDLPRKIEKFEIESINSKIYKYFKIRFGELYAETHVNFTHSEDIELKELGELHIDDIYIYIYNFYY